ncbi:hypothetical protein LCGC14_0123800 [marine sediment metagenome]|uniref:Peptidase M48 domain-containing protein n=1 Tax=marine sediment metagenome TaxID=412755 RepID=A0A0F9VL51_9ZZZZ|nr:hypothetical protein [Phycisphaerae bacterium]
MQVWILIGFVIALSFLTDPKAASTATSMTPVGWWTAAMAAVYIGGAAAMARIGVAATLRVLARAAGAGPSAARRQRLLTMAERAWLLGGFAALLASGYANFVSSTLALGPVPLLALWAALIPFVAALLLTWTIDYRAHRAIRQQMAGQWPPGERPLAIWTRSQYVLFHLRTHLLFIVALLSAIMLANDLLWRAAVSLWPPAQAEWIAAGGAFISAGAVFLLAPLMITRIWKTARLADGPLRRRIEELCDRLNLRYRDVLVWQTEGVLANAAVMGLIPQVRYVLLSDALLERMDERQVMGVFAHEAGHVTGRHLLTMAVFAVTVTMLASAVFTAAIDAPTLDNWVAIGATIGLLVPLWTFAFGWMSRRLERQSDVAAAWILSRQADGPQEQHWDDPHITPEGAALFAGALQRIAQLNGTPTTQPNWRHGSIASRVRYILSLGASGGSRRPIDRLVRRIKWGVWLALAAAVAAHAGLFVLLETG